MMCVLSCSSKLTSLIAADVIETMLCSDMQCGSGTYKSHAIRVGDVVWSEIQQELLMVLDLPIRRFASMQQ